LAIFARDSFSKVDSRPAPAAGSERKVEFRALSKIPEQRRWSETKEEGGGKIAVAIHGGNGGVEKEKRTFHAAAQEEGLFLPSSGSGKMLPSGTDDIEYRPFAGGGKRPGPLPLT